MFFVDEDAEQSQCVNAGVIAIYYQICFCRENVVKMPPKYPTNSLCCFMWLDDITVSVELLLTSLIFALSDYMHYMCMIYCWTPCYISLIIYYVPTIGPHLIYLHTVCPYMYVRLAPLLVLRL